MGRVDPVQKVRHVPQAVPEVGLGGLNVVGRDLARKPDFSCPAHSTPTLSRRPQLPQDPVLDAFGRVVREVVLDQPHPALLRTSALLRRQRSWTRRVQQARVFVRLVLEVELFDQTIVRKREEEKGGKSTEGKAPSATTVMGIEFVVAAPDLSQVRSR